MKRLFWPLAVLGDAGNPLRHRIDHNSVIRDDLLPRDAQIGVLPVVFGYKRVCESFPFSASCTQRAWRRPELIAANPGLPVAWHGDEPWVGTGNPLLDMLSQTTRYSLADDGTLCAPPDYLASRTLPVETVLKMMTINAAYALDRDTEVGSLTAGKCADLIVISADPTAVDPLQIKDTQVETTMVGGKEEYCASGAEALCPAGGAVSDATPGPAGSSPHARASQSQPGLGPERAIDGVTDDSG